VQVYWRAWSEHGSGAECRLGPGKPSSWRRPLFRSGAVPSRHRPARRDDRCFRRGHIRLTRPREGPEESLTASFPRTRPASFPCRTRVGRVPGWAGSGPVDPCRNPGRRNRPGVGGTSPSRLPGEPLWIRRLPSGSGCPGVATEGRAMMRASGADGGGSVIPFRDFPVSIPAISGFGAALTRGPYRPDAAGRDAEPGETGPSCPWRDGQGF